ncbi:hypothetical protein LCGC14_1927290 [marine sediment metagenome]|uniref:Uncharacterized protein n=1 Tax=marine sediment metagenome TaxID=412755 RepID=A0A0F9FNZ1_9ZZZZ
MDYNEELLRRLIRIGQGFPLSSEVFRPPKSSQPEVIELETDIKSPYLLRTEVNVDWSANLPKFTELIKFENVTCELVPQYAAHGYWWTLHSCENHPAVVLKWVKNDM